MKNEHLRITWNYHCDTTDDFQKQTITCRIFSFEGFKGKV